MTANAANVEFRRLTEVEVAERIARSGHRDQLDKVGAPYIRHVERVAGAVREYGPVTEAVGWLHDIIEDTDWTYDLLIERAGISTTVADAVVLLSKVEGESYEARMDRLIDSGNVHALRVKLADLRDHLNPNCPARLRPRYEAALPRIELRLRGLAVVKEPLEAPTWAGYPLTWGEEG